MGGEVRGRVRFTALPMPIAITTTRTTIFAVADIAIEADEGPVNPFRRMTSRIQQHLAAAGRGAALAQTSIQALKQRSNDIASEIGRKFQRKKLSRKPGLRCVNRLEMTRTS